MRIMALELHRRDMEQTVQNPGQITSAHLSAIHMYTQWQIVT